MTSGDIIGLSVFLFALSCGLYGLHRISKPVDYTKEEYEKRLQKGSGIARGAMNAMMYPFEKVLNPKAVEAIHVQRDLKAGYYDVQQENGDGGDEYSLAAAQAGSRATLTGSHRKRIGLLRLFLNIFRSRR